MTTVPTRSWRATTAPRWKKCSSTSRAGGPKRFPAKWTPVRAKKTRQNKAPGRVPHERGSPSSRHLGASHQRDGAALLVSADVVLAAAFGADLLAGAADHHLGFPAELPFADVGVFRAGRRLADRRRDP